MKFRVYAHLDWNTSLDIFSGGMKELRINNREGY